VGLGLLISVFFIYIFFISFSGKKLCIFLGIFLWVAIALNGVLMCCILKSLMFSFPILFFFFNFYLVPKIIEASCGSCVFLVR